MAEQEIPYEFSKQARYLDRLIHYEYLANLENSGNFNWIIGRIGAIEKNWTQGKKLEIYEIPLVIGVKSDPVLFLVEFTYGPDRVHPPYIPPWEQPEPPKPPSGMAIVGENVMGLQGWYKVGINNTVPIGSITVYNGLTLRLVRVGPAIIGDYWMTDSRISTMYTGGVPGSI